MPPLPSRPPRGRKPGPVALSTPLHVGLTGNVAAGKSTVSRLLESWGAAIIDADEIVRALQQPGTPVFDALVERFGPEIVTEEGHLDRPRLRDIMLADPAARESLNAIIHPAVARERRTALDRAADEGAAVVIDVIPLLFEVLDPSRFDAILLVDAPVETRRDRLITNRGLPPQDADRLIAAQMPSEQKRPRADWIIDNTKDVAELEKSVRRVWSELVARADESA